MLSFYPVEQLDREAYRLHLSACGFLYKSCEYTYSNLFAWRNAYGTTYAKTDDGYFFRMRHGGENYYLAPVVTKAAAESAFQMLAEEERLTGGECLRFVCLPKDHADILRALFPTPKITANRGSFDYLYETQSLSDFSGKALHAKRNHLNKFYSLYADAYEYRSMTADDARECLTFNKTWYALNEAYADKEFADERAATDLLLKNFDRLALLGGMLFIDGVLGAYTLASDSYDGSDTLIIHTEKGLYDYPGIYPAICSEFLQHVGTGYTFVNREDDLGDDGLRKSKLSYNPVAFEEKFSAKLPL